MKKIFYYVLALCISANASCSKDAEVDNEVAAGKYTLPTLTASCEEDATRTGLGTNQIVNWSNRDRIAVVNLKTNTIYQYTLVSGSGTSVGKFAPVKDAAVFDDIDDIKAVYPAIAATVAEGKISLSINKEYTEQERVKYGITSWTNNSSAYAFTNNDIKVSYNTSMTTSGSEAQVNFKFRQLATWCNFVFNFTGIPEHKGEIMASLTITTADGTKKISGTAEVDLTDPNQPILKEGTENAVEWKTTGALSSSTLTKSLMLFPVIDGDKLKITVETDMNTFTFYATPTQPLSAGTVLRFPIEVGVNFEKDNAATANDFTYQVVPAEIHDFFYYGEANCLLLAGTTAAGTLDVTPYKTNAYYWNTKDDGSAAPKPAKAQVIWREAGIDSMAEPTVTKNGDKYTLNVSNVQGYGNALVGIYDSSDNLLWSYHIWKPEIDPTSDANLLEYKYTNSGTYHVMPIALGATAKVDIGPTETATANTLKTYGLFYQWGRKDPLGRPGALAATKEQFMTTYAGATGTTAYNLGDASREIDLVTLLGGEDIEEKDGKKTGKYMVDYVTKNPTHFIMVPAGKYNGDWYGLSLNNNLWGNPIGSTYPYKGTLPQSIFDPCPQGYRVAPRDLWISFTDNGLNRSVDDNNWAKEVLNILNISADGKKATMNTQNGFFLCYGIDEDGLKKWQKEPADFYPAEGYRKYDNGDLWHICTDGCYWSNSPYDLTSTSGGLLYFYNASVQPLSGLVRSYGSAVRCVKEN